MIREIYNGELNVGSRYQTKTDAVVTGNVDVLIAGGGTAGIFQHSLPLSCSQKIDNVLLAGRCISATHKAYGCTGPTVQCMVTGQAAGLAAAICVKQGASIHSLDTDVLCKNHLTMV